MTLKKGGGGENRRRAERFQLKPEGRTHETREKKENRGRPLRSSENLWGNAARWKEGGLDARSRRKNERFPTTQTKEKKKETLRVGGTTKHTNERPGAHEKKKGSRSTNRNQREYKRRKKNNSKIWRRGLTMKTSSGLFSGGGGGPIWDEHGAEKGDTETFPTTGRENFCRKSGNNKARGEAYNTTTGNLKREGEKISRTGMQRSVEKNLESGR